PPPPPSARSKVCRLTCLVIEDCAAEFSAGPREEKKKKLVFPPVTTPIAIAVVSVVAGLVRR
ncbi:hypothetical protein CSUI_011205, partial [Cystoisospora suis]